MPSPTRQFMSLVLQEAAKRELDLVYVACSVSPVAEFSVIVELGISRSRVRMLVPHFDISHAVSLPLLARETVSSMFSELESRKD